jgi:hypothetical protein
MADMGEWPARAAAYAAVVVGLTVATRALSDRYYFHWHHWAAAVMLAPLTQSHHPRLSLTLLGVVIGQHVDGSGRFSCAPLWHRHAAYTGVGYRYA